MKTPQFKHQKIGTAALVKNPAFFLADEMGVGKSKQVIDAACALAEQWKIDTVVIVAPASVRCVWLDKEIGEIKKHSGVRNIVYEFRKNFKEIWGDRYDTPAPNINWVVTNYEWLRSAAHIETLTKKIAHLKTLLVLDESSYVKNRTAKQTKAVKKLREHCSRCVLLNGTPVTNSPLDLWSQMEILSPEILKKDFHNFYHFRSEYCDMRSAGFGGRHFQQVVRYKNLDHLAKKLAPYVLRREKKDCLDLPDKLYSVREVQLNPESWKRYQELKRDCLMTLGEGDVRLEPNAAVRIMRLAQLTSGILGGTFVDGTGEAFVKEDRAVEDLSDEKLNWAIQYLTSDCTAKAVIVWTRWRRERERLAEELRAYNKKSNQVRYVFELYGGQARIDRDIAVKYFSDNALTNYGGATYTLIAQPHAGGFGLNLVAASEAIYLSNDFALGIRLQSEDRMHRPGQSNPCLYIDVLATGPAGQKTIDHVIFKALREKKNVADLTTSEWRKELESES